MLLSWLQGLVLGLLAFFSSATALSHEVEQHVSEFMASSATDGRHTNNWAVLVCSSRYWFNYRVSLYGSASLLLAKTRSIWPTLSHCTGPSND